MAEARQPTRRSAIATRQQVSAGGVAYRCAAGGPEIAIVAVATPGQARWQLPKGLVDPGETPAAAAVREVREEAGLTTDLLAPIETIEYWYVGQDGSQRTRFHKFVHFFLLAWRSGDVSDHDQEVVEARWVGLDEALGLLAFENERRVVARARELIAEQED